MHYTEYLPSPVLQPYVRCIWVLESTDHICNRSFDRILPDGCTELIFHFATPFEKKEKGLALAQSPCFLYGQLSTYIELRPVSHTSVLGVRFHPYGLSAFSFLPQHFLTDQPTDINELFSHPDKDIHEQLYETNNIGDRVIMINDFLTANLLLDVKGFQAGHIKGIQYAVQQIKQTRGAGKINTISEKLNISNRELERRFRKYIGLSPKQLSKTFRFQEVLQKKYLAYSLTDIAHLSGYYDQSHFIRDFKSFSGMHPGGFFKMENSFSDFFITH